MGRKTRGIAILCGAGIIAVLAVSLFWAREDAPGEVGTEGAVPPTQRTMTKPPDGGSAVQADDLNEALNEVVDEAVIPERAAEANAELALKLERVKRSTFVRSVPAYSQLQASLKNRIREENSGISEDKIDDLVKQAAESEEEFWQKGDFSDTSSFESIYRARATLELCLEADPTNAAALRQLVEVLQAGWPMIISEEGDSELAGEAKMNNFALHTPLWTLWESHVSKEDDVSFEDFERAIDLIIVPVPPDVYAAYMADYREQNPSANEKSAHKAALAAGQARRLRVVEWALDVCQKKGPDWDVYAAPLRTVHKSMITSSRIVPFYMRTSGTLDPGGDYMEDAMRYRLGRFDSFRGPTSRAEKITPLHEYKRMKAAD